MDIDVSSKISELAKAMEALALQLQQLDRQRQELANRIVKCQGAIEFLQGMKQD